jgi:hypothetical protein
MMFRDVLGVILIPPERTLLVYGYFLFVVLEIPVERIVSALSRQDTCQPHSRVIFIIEIRPCGVVDLV